MGKITLIAVAIIFASYAGSGVLSSPSNQCCQYRSVEGGTGNIENGLYTFSKKEDLSSGPENCVDNCVYVKNGEKYCFKEEPNTKVDVNCMTAASYLLLIGGYPNSMESWTPFDFTPPTYNTLPGNRRGSRAANLQGRFYSCGSPSSSDNMYCYTTVPDQETWTRAPDLQVGRISHTLTAVGDKLVAAGGSTSFSTRLSSVEILNQDGTAWTSPGWSLSEPVEKHCAVADPDSNSSLVIIGGMGNSGVSKLVRRYDLNTKNVEDMTDLPTGFEQQACTIYKSKITVSGGYNNKGPSDEVLQLDLRANKWVSLPPLNKKRYDHAMALLNDELYVFGGGGVSKVVEKLEATVWTVQNMELQGSFINGGSVVVN